MCDVITHPCSTLLSYSIDELLHLILLGVIIYSYIPLTLIKVAPELWGAANTINKSNTVDEGILPKGPYLPCVNAFF